MIECWQFSLIQVKFFLSIIHWQIVFQAQTKVVFFYFRREINYVVANFSQVKAFLPQRRISVFSLYILSLFADTHKLMLSVDVEISSSNESIWSKREEQYSGCHYTW